MLCDSDNQEQENYPALLRDDNFENNFDTAIVDTKIETDQLHRWYRYSDIDNGKQNLTLKLLSIIDNIKSKTTVVSNTTFPTIIYHSKSYLIFLNDGKDFFYFFAAFFTSFFFENGRYLGKDNNQF